MSAREIPELPKRETAYSKASELPEQIYFHEAPDSHGFIMSYWSDSPEPDVGGGIVVKFVPASLLDSALKRLAAATAGLEWQCDYSKAMEDEEGERMASEVLAKLREGGVSKATKSELLLRKLNKFLTWEESRDPVKKERLSAAFWAGAQASRKLADNRKRQALRSKRKLVEE